MPAVRCDQECIADAEVPRLVFVFKVQRRASAQQQDPFALRLVVPALRWADGLAGMNALEPPMLAAG